VEGRQEGKKTGVPLDGDPIRFSKEVVVGTKKLLIFQLVICITLSQ